MSSYNVFKVRCPSEIFLISCAAICLLLAAFNVSALAQPFISLTTEDVQIELEDSAFKIPIYLQTLEESVAGFRIIIAFDNPDAAVFDISNPINDSAEVVWNWGFYVDALDTEGRIIEIVAVSLPHGDPIPPSETTHQLLMLNAQAGEYVNEDFCDSSGIVYFDEFITQFSSAGGALLEFTYENGSYNLVCPMCGDANYDKEVNVSDAVLIINFVFAGGKPPFTPGAGDVNCDGVCNVSDAVGIINYIFAGGKVPCDTDGDGLPDC